MSTPEAAAAAATAAAPPAILYHEQYHPPFLPALLLLPFVLPPFWNYAVTVTNEELTFGYSWKMAQKTASQQSIKSIEVEKGEIHGLWKWSGWGIRYGFGAIGYISKDGPGVRVVLVSEDGGKESTYVFNCEQPETVCKLCKPVAHKSTRRLVSGSW